jgi:hypothetical protein
MLKLFIGSSSQAVDRVNIHELAADLSKTGFFEVRPWYNKGVFPEGYFTLEALLEQLDTTDLALLVFAKDEQTVCVSKDEPQLSRLVTRDNVILEYGMFLAALGLDRVFLLQEKGIDLPSDLKGLTCQVFESRPDGTGRDVILDNSLKQAIQEMTRKWSAIGFRKPSFDDRGVGLKRTIDLRKKKYELLQEMFRFYDIKKNTEEVPLYLDSTQACKESYIDALANVKKRFWTTTYISSGFWTKQDPAVLTANTEMLKREPKVQARRLFLITRSPEEEAQSYKDKLILFRRQKERHLYQDLEAQLESTTKKMNSLIKQGCEVRVGYDATQGLELRELLDTHFNVHDSEIALYDDFRLDLFGGGSLGRITDLRIYTEFMRGFAEILQRAESYFDQIWNEATPPAEYFKHIKTACESAGRRIDYASNWLARYEFALPDSDKTLKTVELARVKEVLRQKTLQGRIKKYLDIGTCTGRYPRDLKKEGYLDPKGDALGIDDDDDCIEFARAQGDSPTTYPRVRFEREDFLATTLHEISGKYDLVTCMLGTLSHFGWNRHNNYEDSLQSALKRMKHTLENDGLLIIANWSGEACSRRDFLSIYSDYDKDMLAHWTPSKSELEERLKVAGLVVEEQIEPDPRLDLFICR